VSHTGYGAGEASTGTTHRVAGSTQTPGPLGKTCSLAAEPSSGGDCYESCRAAFDGNCTVVHGMETTCWWSTCEDSVQQILWVLDEVSDMLCIDLDRVVASGYSNGGMFSFEMATNERTAGIFAAIMPVEGSQVYGYRLPPVRQANLTVIALWANLDLLVPPFGVLGVSNAHQLTLPRTVQSPSLKFYWEPARATTSLFAASLGCTERVPVAINVSKYSDSLSCVAWLDCNEASKVVECLATFPHWIPNYFSDLSLDLLVTPPETLMGQEAVDVRAYRAFQVAMRTLLDVGKAIYWAWNEISTRLEAASA